jgi:carboxyl-terminal processing protease
MNSRLKWTVLGSSACVVVLLLLGARSGRAVANDDVYGHLKVYTEVLERIKLEYVEEPDMKSVTLGAINGLLESVDPFASYLNADQYRQFEKSHSDAKASVGLILAKRYGYVAVVDTLPGSPADKANIGTGDLIESINGVATRDMPLAYAEQLFRGAPDSTIDISVLRLRNPDPQKITLSRAVIALPAVLSKMMPDQVGYVHVQNLGADRVEQAKAKILALKKQGAKYIILDLRHCSTGEDSNGVELANLFLDKGEIVTLRGQKSEKQEFAAKSDSEVWSGPLVVITDRATAGGSEITAGALLDDKRAQIVGERSYGAAGVRKTIQMDDGGAIILAVAKYYSPSGKPIQEGVVPSVQVAENDSAPEVDQDGNPLPGTPKKSTEDNLLKQSIDLVMGKTTVAQLNAVPAPDGVEPTPHPIVTKSPQGSQQQQQH